VKKAGVLVVRFLELALSRDSSESNYLSEPKRSCVREAQGSSKITPAPLRCQPSHAGYVMNQTTSLMSLILVKRQALKSAEFETPPHFGTQKMFAPFPTPGTSVSESSGKSKTRHSISRTVVPW
jgi:hypothetical protein